MERRWLILLISVVIIGLVSFPVLVERVNREASQTVIQPVVDLQDLTRIGKSENLPLSSLLSQLLQLRYSTLGVNEPVLKELIDEGLVIPTVGPSPDFKYYQVGSQSLLEQLEQHFSLLGKTVTQAGAGVLGVNLSPGEEERIGTGWNREWLDWLQSQGFELYLRPRNWRGMPPSVLADYWEEVGSLQGVKGLIFAGEEILGYGNSRSIEWLASFLEEENLVWGYVEFIGQKGEVHLATLAPQHTLRVHSIPPEELKNYSPQRASERFMRAAKERSVRVLYVRLFTEPGFSNWDRNLNYLSFLSDQLVQGGFSLGSASPMLPFSVGKITLFVLAFSLSLALFVLGNSYFSWKWWTIPVFFLGFALVLILNQIAGMKIMGLTAGLTYPTLAVIILIDAWRKNQSLVWSVIFAFAVTLAGGILVSVALYHWLFVLRLHQFWGVKVSLVVPLLLIILYLFKSGGLNHQLEQVALGRMRRFELVVLLVMGVAAVIYLTRSGNFPILPASGLELRMRSFLENLLFIRPRTKEFLIGYPALWLLLAYRKEQWYPIYHFVLWVAVGIGFTTMFNSFCHLHTPWSYILLRFGHALWLSLPVFLVYFLLVKICLFVWRSIKEWGI
ncbi:MAG: hypothetical protein PWP04_530 [Candidatus Atribacteria bacterium]|nr:hypothetical protein [Candidatus Atribacteria bacterium]